MSAAVVADSRLVLARHARSFHLAAWFLPAGRTDDAAVLYALCRLVDDLVDENDDADGADRELDHLRAELRGERTQRPLVAALHPDSHDAVHELIEGVRLDLHHVPFRDDRELLRYCYGVAGTVGLAMSPILGVTDPVAKQHAVDLGVGMQITNICRDVLEDAERGRVYLPESRLQRHGSSSTELIAGTASRDAVAAVVLELLELADRYYRSGEAGLRFIPWRSRTAIAVAARVYRAIGVRLRDHGGDALAGRTIVPAMGKVAAVVDALGRLLGPARHAPHDDRLHEHLAGLPGCIPQF